MAPRRATSRQGIITAARSVIGQRAAGSVSVDRVAKEAGCAKGLVHYHFKTKRGLFEAVAEDLATKRETAWRTAFDAPTPKDAIDRTWHLLTKESANGTLRAWSYLFGGSGGLPDQTVSSLVARFSRELGRAAAGTLRRMGLAPTVPPEEIGWLLGAVVDGMGLKLLAGADPGELEGAYAALWLGILSLGRSRDHG